MKIKWKTYQEYDDNGKKTEKLMGGGKPTIQFSYLTGGKNTEGGEERRIIRMGGDKNKELPEVAEATIPEVIEFEINGLKKTRTNPEILNIRMCIEGYKLDGREYPGIYPHRKFLEIVDDPSKPRPKDADVKDIPK